MSVRTRAIRFAGIALAGTLALSVSACSDNGEGGGDELVTVGFVAVGPEGPGVKPTKPTSKSHSRRKQAST